MFSARLSTNEAARLCHRWHLSLSAGVDLRRTLSRETEQSRGTQKDRLNIVRAAVDRGETLTDGLAAAGSYFPPLFRKLTEVGERTGHTAEIFGRLAEHYEHQLTLRRQFRSAIAWPAFQMAVALAVIGFLIWIMGWFQGRGQNIDFLGWGLAGTSGLLIYLSLLALIFAVSFSVWRGFRVGAAWVSPVKRLVAVLPGIGPPLATLALSRFTWNLHLALDAGMDLIPALGLSFDNCEASQLESARQPVLQSVAAGNSLHDAFRLSGRFPARFLDVVQVGEDSGQLVEALGRLSRQLEQESRSALAVLTQWLGYLIWLLVAAFLIMLIFRLASFYVGTIEGFLPK